MYEWSISGIPCQIEPTHVSVVKGSYSYNAPSDWDYYGYTDVEFDVYDRKGYRAKWLERKMTKEDKAEIIEMILEKEQEE